MCPTMKNSKMKITTCNGFTLCELIIVMAVISIGVILTIPLARNSKAASSVRQEAENLAEIIKSGAEIFDITGSDILVRLDKERRYYGIEIRNSEGEFMRYKPEKFSRGFSNEIHLADTSGLAAFENDMVIKFSRGEKMPSGKVVLANEQCAVEVVFEYRKVELNEIE